VTASANALALAEVVGGDIKALTAQLQSALTEIGTLQTDLASALQVIQDLTDRVAALENPPPG
jgi:hypothetical protein